MQGFGLTLRQETAHSLLYGKLMKRGIARNSKQKQVDHLLLNLGFKYIMDPFMIFYHIPVRYLPSFSQSS